MIKLTSKKDSYISKYSPFVLRKDKVKSYLSNENTKQTALFFTNIAIKEIIRTIDSSDVHCYFDDEIISYINSFLDKKKYIIDVILNDITNDDDLKYDIYKKRNKIH